MFKEVTDTQEMLQRIVANFGRPAGGQKCVGLRSLTVRGVIFGKDICV